jgi:arylsulfatase A-like enzyme
MKGMSRKHYNVILVIADSLRKDHVGCYGNDWIRTPNIDGFAKEAVMYTKAYPESLPTIPVRRAIYTGRRVFPFEPVRRMRKGIPWIANAGWQPLSDEDVTLSEVFKAAGYRTALIGDNYHLFEPGMNFNRGFDEWVFMRGQEWDKYRSAQLIREGELERYLTPKLRGTTVEKLLRRYLSNVYFRRSEEDWFAPQTFREAIRWLEENRDAERFLLILEPFDPHEPWDPPHEFVEMYDPNYQGREVITPKYGPPDYLTERELRHMRAHYAGEVTLLDKWFGFFLEKFYELNLDKNTVLVFISDHGHQLGEHNLTGKVAWGLYPELLDIPLLIKHPESVGSGEKVDEYVYDHDLFPTICHLAGVGHGQIVDGINILSYVERESVEEKRSYVTSGFASYLMYRDDEYWFISNREGEEAQLYNLKEDPKLQKNIAQQQPELAETIFQKIVEDAGGFLPKIEPISGEAYRWYEQLYL